MNEILSIKKLIEMLSLLPADTPFLNAPTKPHTYLKTNNVALVVGETIFNQNPTKTVGEIVGLLSRIMANEYHVANEVKESSFVYLVSNTHNAGEAVIGFKMTFQGISLIKEDRF